MRYIKLIVLFFQSSAQEELAYRANFWIHLLHALLNLATGAAGMWILFRQVQTLRGWDFTAALAILGVYLTLDALRGLVFGPSFEALAGMGQEVWSGNFDFTLLRPLDVQFLVSFRRWNLYALLDLALGLAVLGTAAARSGQPLSLAGASAFLLALLAGLAALYAVLLAFTGLVFWSPAFTFAWVFDAVFQMARYPVDLYPGWLRLALTWIVPVGLMTTLPARVLTQGIPPQTLWASLAAAAALLAASSAFFRFAARRYTSASS